MEQPKNIPVVVATNTLLRRNILVKIDGNFNNVENVYVAPILENCPLISPEVCAMFPFCGVDATKLRLRSVQVLREN